HFEWLAVWVQCHGTAVLEGWGRSIMVSRTSSFPFHCRSRRLRTASSYFAGKLSTEPTPKRPWLLSPDRVWFRFSFSHLVHLNHQLPFTRRRVLPMRLPLKPLSTVSGENAGFD